MPHNSAAELRTLLAPVPYEEWSETKTTLQLYTQIVGKIQLRYSRLRNHWWNITYRPSPRGIVTHLLNDGDTFFDIEFDFIDHVVKVRSNKARESLIVELHDGTSVAQFYEALFALLRSIDLDLSIYPVPYGQTDSTPFHQDTRHVRYDGVLVRRWWDALLWTTDVLNEFGFTYLGKQSEPQIFWHSFDLAVGRYSGRLSQAPAPDNPVMREAYQSEVIAFGFWAGDPNIPAPTFYTYTAPEPPSLIEQPLRPPAAHWAPSGAGHLGLLSYDVVRESVDPRAMLLDFYTSGFEAGTRLAKWSLDGLIRSSAAS